MGILHPGLQDFLVVFSAVPLAPNAMSVSEKICKRLTM